MGETQKPEVMVDQMAEVQLTNIPKERRNGMWNIFEGADSSVLEKLGLSQELVRQLVTGADDTVSENLSQLVSSLRESADDTVSESLSQLVSSLRESADDRCCCERAKIIRSFSTTVGEEMQEALRNRHRRNAVGNLFEILTPSQKLLLVERLQEQLERLNCLCDSNDKGSDVILLSELSSSKSSSSPPRNSSATGSSHSQGEIACR